MVNSTKSNKAKARRLQNLVKEKILELDTSFEDGIDVRCALMGESGEDIKLSNRARQKFPFSVECKALKSPAAYNWYDQAKENAAEAEPLVIFKGDNKKPLAIVDLDIFLDLVYRQGVLG